MGRPIGRLFLALFASLAALSPAKAEDTPPFDWRGFYIGYHLGGALDLVDVDNPFGPSIFGDTVRTPGPLAGGQLGYNWQRGAGLFGVEADVSWADLDGTNTCFAYSGFYLSANCRANIDALGTLTGRLGWIVTADGRTLLYGKAGLAWAHSDIDAVSNDAFGSKTDDNGVTWGWTVGAGVERAIAPRWTVKAEYGFLSFDDGFTAPAGGVQPAPPSGPLVNTPSAHTDVSQHLHQFKLGMNYKLGTPMPTTPVAPFDGGELVKRYTLIAGARYVYGWGQFHKDLGISRRVDSSLASRLTYDNSSVDGAELFARLDTPFNLMIKGFIGTTTSGGKLNDEDWGIPTLSGFVPYSNTYSQADNDINYGIVDVGYAVWRGARHSVAPFVGYSELHQDMVALGCVQIANPNSDCVPALPNNLRGITEDDTWRALRVGLVANVAIAPRLSATADVAYLPYVEFEGVDDHILRDLLSPESGKGEGVQIEATLSYAITDALSLGVGGRYWSMWTNEGTVNFGGFGEFVPMRYASEQAQLLVQGSYKFGYGSPARAD